METMAVEASFMYNQALDCPDFDDLNNIFLNSDIAERGTSNPDHPVHSSRPEDRAFVDDFADNVLDSLGEYGDLSCPLVQENMLGLDDFGLHGTGDSTSLDNPCEALGTEFDLPMLQASGQSFDPFLSPRAAELPLSWEENSTENSSSSAIPVNPGESCQPTPGLPERSTPVLLSAPNDDPDTTIGGSETFSTEHQRWHVTLSRSRAADRYFLYGVLTTKIFCRPSCASRRPSRRHIKFFSFPGAIEAAKQANFRPCKRCKPETLGTMSTGVLAISHALRRIIAETFERRSKEEKENLKLASVAKSAGLSTFHFHRLFKATTQVTPADFVTACHALALQDALCTYSTGELRPDPNAANLSSRWSERTARKALGGLSPEEYANGADSRSFMYCRVSSPAGDLEVTYSRDERTPNMNVHAVVLLQGFAPQIDSHFWSAKVSEDRTQRLQQCVRELEGKCQDRDAELAADVLSVLWRARLWLKLTHDNGLG